MSELLEFLSTHEDAFRKARLAALYSDFRQLRTTNPDGYAANQAAWLKGLADAAKEGLLPNHGMSGDHFILRTDEALLRALETKEWGRPLALGAVIQDAIAKKEMIPLNDFMTSKNSIYQKSWPLHPWQLVTWGLRQLGMTVDGNGEDSMPSRSLVLVPNLETASKELENRKVSRVGCTDNLYTKKLFGREFSTIFGGQNPISEDDIDVLLKFLARDKGLIVYNGQTIRFTGSTETNSAITSEETTIAALKTLMSDLDIQIDGLSRRVEALNVSARDAVARKNRVTALAALRSKKLVESNLSRQMAVQAQLEEIYSKIGQASDQLELVRIMEGSTGVLKTLNARIGGVERVDNIVDDLKEQMTQVEEIGKVIAEPGQDANAIDEDEVNDELDAMEAEVTERRKIAERQAREARVNEKAAETKRRLASLDTLPQEAALEQRGSANQMPTSEVLHDDTTEESAQRLNRLSLEDQMPLTSNE